VFLFFYFVSVITVWAVKLRLDFLQQSLV